MNADKLTSLDLDPDALGPVTDLYQLTMMAGFETLGRGEDRAVFELFARKLPPHRSYLVFAGLEQAILALLNLRFDPAQVDAIARLPAFRSIPAAWFDRLCDFRFEGDLWAIPEGTVVFENEPLIRVSARLPEAQLVETLLLASVGYATSVASKAARIVGAAQGRGLFDFGARRGHGLQASFIAARSAYLAGFDGTSQVEAARRLGIPAQGTMAHSWVQSFETEREAFEAFAALYPAATLLVDTYDTPRGVQLAAEIDPPIGAIRIDSGDLAAGSQQARAILDRSGRSAVRIIGSGDLDEHKIAALRAADAPIDVFGVGSELITSGDAPMLSMVYKMVECNGAGRIKVSPGKQTYPHAKQVDRRLDSAGRFESDRVVRVDEGIGGQPLLRQVLDGGRLVAPLPALDEIRGHCRQELGRLSDELKRLDRVADYPVSFSEVLTADADRLALVHAPPAAMGTH